jgi:hypothetical protein
VNDEEFRFPDEWKVVRPGEVLVLRYTDKLTAAKVDAIRKRLTEFLPGAKIMIAEADEIAIQLPEEVQP